MTNTYLRTIMTIMVTTAAKKTKPPKTPKAIMPPMLSLPLFPFGLCLTEDVSPISLSNGRFTDDPGAFFVGESAGFLVDEAVALVIWLFLVTPTVDLDGTWVLVVWSNVE